MVWQLPTFLIAGAVAQHCLHVHGVYGVVQPLLIGVNECNGMILLTELLCQGQANLSTSNNDDIHMFPLFHPAHRGEAILSAANPAANCLKLFQSQRQCQQEVDQNTNQGRNAHLNQPGQQSIAQTKGQTVPGTPDGCCHA